MGARQHGRALEDLEAETVAWCREMLTLSPIALRMFKAGFNAADDGLAGIQQLAGDATMLFYMSEEGQEGRNAYVEKRAPDFSAVPDAPLRATAPGGARRTGSPGPAAHAPGVRSSRCWSGRRRPTRTASLGLVAGSPARRRRPRDPDRDELRQRLRRRVRGTDDSGSGRAGSRRRVCPPRGVSAASRRLRRRRRRRARARPLDAPWLLVVGAACIAGRLVDPGGPHPYGYAGLGEVFVFVFFGLVAVVGTAYATRARHGARGIAAVPVGLFASALLAVNNLRDIDMTRRAGKRTLARAHGRQGDPPASTRRA